jgi:hypothetical protein
MREHAALCVAAGRGSLLVLAAGWGYAAYRASQDEKAQYTLGQGMAEYERALADPKAHDFSKAEASFTKVRETGSAGLRDIAKLYLARIALQKGMPREAAKIYAEVVKKPANEGVRRLSLLGLKALEAQR